MIFFPSVCQHRGSTSRVREKKGRNLYQERIALLLRLTLVFLPVIIRFYIHATPHHTTLICVWQCVRVRYESACARVLSCFAFKRRVLSPSARHVLMLFTPRNLSFSKAFPSYCRPSRRGPSPTIGRISRSSGCSRSWKRATTRR